MSWAENSLDEFSLKKIKKHIFTVTRVYRKTVKEFLDLRGSSWGYTGENSLSSSLTIQKLLRAHGENSSFFGNTISNFNIVQHSVYLTEKYRSSNRYVNKRHRLVKPSVGGEREDNLWFRLTCLKFDDTPVSDVYQAVIVHVSFGQFNLTDCTRLTNFSVRCRSKRFRKGKV